MSVPVSVDTKLIGLLGYPLKQTFAPRMFNETFRELKMDYFYFPIEVQGEDLGTVVKAIRCMNFAGFFVTKPNKIRILEHLDELDELAEKTGSANTVTSTGGRLRGYNTDGTGFVQALLEETGLDPGGNTFFIFGAGGASRALCFALASRGAKKLCIIDPLDQASESLVRDINRWVRQCAQAVPFAGAPVGDLVGESDVLVNASGVGMYPHTDETPLDKRHLREGLLVCDLTYNPPETRLLLEARQAGCRTMNGVGMAVHQGALGFALLTGRPEPTELMRQAMQRIIAKRSNEPI
jgi:shikimate dehydrogenase